jgi:uncharacterized membrane-anchored protein YitT (DUF2179 family)
MYSNNFSLEFHQVIHPRLLNNSHYPSIKSAIITPHFTHKINNVRQPRKNEGYRRSEGSGKWTTDEQKIYIRYI